MPNVPDKNEEALNEKLSQIRLQGAEDAYRASADKAGLPFSDLKTAPIDSSASLVIPEDQARAGQIAAIMHSGDELTVALIDPNNPETKSVLEQLSKRGFKIKIILTTPKGLERALSHYQNTKTGETFSTGSLEIAEKDLDSLQNQIKTVSDLKNQISNVSVTKLLEILLAGALKTGASDIHFEPEDKVVRLRYRLDGVLQDVTNLDTDSYRSVLNRLKVLSRLKLNIHQTAQDGRFTIHQQSVDIEVRVSILPSEYGETVVMRLLDPRTIKSKLEDLGMRPDLLTLVKEHLDKPNGSIFTTGPTGSGKTTSLYAFVNYLNSSDTKIITIEDPIEYHVQGVSQTQVEPAKNYTFANGLRAIVRQDPDVILVGEIRDNETAEIALNAALTGHLVLSTIHTNDAAGTIPRLIDLKINPTIIAPALRLAMAQRLVRRLCPECKKKAPLDASEAEQIQKELAPIKDKLKITKADEVYEPVGCKACNNTGYKGRVGVYEAFTVTPEMEQLIMNNPSVTTIEDLAVKQGMITMHQDALLKLLEGVTSLEEIKRILG